MRIYEEVFIVDPQTPEDQVDGIIADIESVVKENGGQIDKVEKWGVRKLAYPVQKRTEGAYVLVQFRTDAKAIQEIERRLRVNELVLRNMTVRIDEKLKWLEKRRRKREQREARMRAAAARPATPMPGQPIPEQPAAPPAS